jgi:acyl-CoA thioester hydrolase
MELLFEDYVREEYLDFNQHMNVVAYYTVFNIASGNFNRSIGFEFDKAEREGSRMTIFTLESHLTYQKEITEGNPFEIYGRILDFDEKRIHFFEEMRNEAGDILATCESMFMTVNLDTRKVGRFSDSIQAEIKAFYEKTKNEPWPQSAGKKIGIPSKEKKYK